jgi:isopenicillin N synthase-like dioxygenase
VTLTDWKTAADLGTVVPVIDIEPFRTGDAAARAQVAAEIGAACEEIGFILISGHGLAPEAIEEMYDVSAAFFAQDQGVKQQYASPTGNRYRGYNWATRRETLEVGRYDDVVAAETAGYSGEWLDRVEANTWPQSPATLEGTWRSYYAQCEGLATTIMELFALALGLPEGWFDDKFDRHTSYLSANHYQPQLTSAEPGSLRLGAHTDIGSLTILYQDGAPGGLQVLDRRGRWCDVPAVAGTFVVNLGDLMAKWTNDRWVATRHRVVNPEPEAAKTGRISIPFFQHPNYDALIECIPTCTDEANPPRYPAVFGGNWAEFRMANYELRGEQ